MLFASCSSKKSEIVMSYGDASIDENTYFYELAMMKSQLLQEYSGATTDVPALWMQSIGDGVTFDDYSYLECQVNIKTVLYFADYALQHDGALTKDEEKTVRAQVDDIVEQFGSKAALNKYLENYAMSYDMLIDYYELYALYNKGISLAYAVGGDHEIPIEDAEKYYRNNFVTVKHIAIGTEFAGTDEDGNYIYYTEEEKEAKRQLIDQIISALENGADFDKLLELSEDGFAKTYPDGYTITKGVLGKEMLGYENVAFALEEGEWDTFELEGTSFYIIKKEPLLESDFRNCYTNIMSNLLKASMVQVVLDKNEEFYVDEEIVDRYNMAMIPPLG